MNWTASSQPDATAVSNLQEALQVSPVIARLLVQRGISTFEEAKTFFRPNFQQLHDPFLMSGMQAAVARIKSAIQKEERIMVYGDYDVDGTTSVALVYSYLESETTHLQAYIPDRYREGYGISKQGIDAAKAAGVTLIIALDCGIKAVEQVAYAKSLGIDFIICDHHLPEQKMPDAVAILNPKQPHCEYTYKELCGCAIGFKLIQALHKTENRSDEDLLSYLDLVATATAADIVPLTGENRTLVFLGLQQMRHYPRIGFASFLSTLKKPVRVSDLVFVIAPRINAAGRMQQGSTAVKLLTAKNHEEALPIARTLEMYNTQRKEVEEQITQEALAQIQEEQPNTTASVVCNADWHKGVVGIVASRLIEHYYRPTIVLTKSGGVWTGSVRSVKGFNVYQALEHCQEHLQQFGGHAFAAGLTLKESQLNAFKAAFETAVQQSLPPELKQPSHFYDAAINFSEISPKLYRILQQMAPFGPKNMTPVFKTSHCRDQGNSRAVGNDQSHLKLLTLDSHGTPMEGIGFGLAHHLPKIKAQLPFSILYSIDENEFNGNVSLQLKIRGLLFET